MRKHIADVITGCRIICSVLMAFLPVFSVRFYAAYLLCGLSDIADGVAARKTDSAGISGARLDTAADLIFAAVSMAKLLPQICIPVWLWVWIAFIAAIKLANLALTAVRRKRLASVHTVMNKLTGLVLFLLPLTLGFIDLKCSAAVVCSIATLSAMQEGYYIKTGRETVM